MSDYLPFNRMDGPFDSGVTFFDFEEMEKKDGASQVVGFVHMLFVDGDKKSRNTASFDKEWFKIHRKTKRGQRFPGTLTVWTGVCVGCLLISMVVAEVIYPRNFIPHLGFASHAAVDWARNMLVKTEWHTPTRAPQLSYHYESVWWLVENGYSGDFGDFIKNQFYTGGLAEYAGLWRLYINRLVRISEAPAVAAAEAPAVAVAEAPAVAVAEAPAVAVAAAEAAAAAAAADNAARVREANAARARNVSVMAAHFADYVINGN